MHSVRELNEASIYAYKVREDWSHGRDLSPVSVNDSTHCTV